PYNHDGTRLANVVGVGVEREAEDGNTPPSQSSNHLLGYREHMVRLRLVHPQDGFEQGGVDACRFRMGQESPQVFREARPPETRSSTKEMRPDPWVQPHPLRHLVDAASGKSLADSRHQVDEADFCGQEGIARVLYQLRHLGRCFYDGWHPLPVELLVKR